MKKIYKNIIIATFSVGLIGCNKFLDREPLSNITPQQYFNTESDLAAYTITYYNFPTHGGYNIGIFKDDNGTDNQATTNANVAWVKGQWHVPKGTEGYDFGNIRAINYFLAEVTPKIEAGKITGTPANINHYLGEAYFLRAYEYFDRLQSYGDYPIVKTVLPDNEDELIEASKRRPRNEVARFILQDLDKAISLLKSSPVEGKNRISKEVAQLFRSRVALFEGTWLKYHKGTAQVPGGMGWPGTKVSYLSGFSINIDSEINYFLTEAMASAKVVADAFPLVANDHNTTGTAVFSNPYFKMYGDNSQSGYSEVLFWRQYSADKSVGHYTNGFLTGGANSGYTRGFVDAFLMKNGLPIYASGSGYQGDADLTTVKVDRDERLQLFMRVPGDYLAVTQQDNSYPDIINSVTERKAVTGYNVKKGLNGDAKYLTDAVLTEAGCIVFRAAEAYLNYIEACYVKNNSLDSDADRYWKALRVRAGVSENYNATIAATDLTKENDWAVYSAGQKIDATLYNIRRERRCEFIAEGIRNNDLRRWRAMDQLRNYQIEGMNLWTSMYDKPTYKNNNGTSKLVALPAASPNISAKTLSVYIRPYQIIQQNNLYYNGITWTKAHYLSPIGFENFLRTSKGGNVATSVIYQNPGWPVQADGIPTE
ncbi:RagB/SusD family nutrient uptake outer membrane protein [Capnocytophaga sp. oral taxon 324]|uniref:RagB/SusD family nutrient uptake outer membrane protein n=1 Tax=Capnocytophaga sp. oral taxon 324 TaxID=712211 RepID=UPI0002A40FDE|nr:RagB/SusD family nutrient uptake outer membrane protein [Capnocytophaga sp. oral taxon 324]EKY11544.1 SusD family protein [Capnocytophaga sp. oral taxon 324 str. F0483]